MRLHSRLINVSLFQMSIIKSAGSNNNLEQDRREVIAEVIAGLIAGVIEEERRRDAATGRPWR